MTAALALCSPAGPPPPAGRKASSQPPRAASTQPGAQGLGVAAKAALALVAIQIALPLRQFAGLLHLPDQPWSAPWTSSWTKCHDRFSWRMKSTVVSPALWLTVDDAAAAKGAHQQIALCHVSSRRHSEPEARFERLADINPAQRAEVCERYSSLHQYARHLARRAGSEPIMAVHANSWESLNHHPFQPRFNASHNVLGADSRGAVLPWIRTYGAWDRKWRPVWQATHAFYTLQHAHSVEFFALQNGVAGELPWLQGRFTPRFVEALDGHVEIELTLAVGQNQKARRKVFAISHPACAQHSPPRCRAEFPPPTQIARWRIAANDNRQQHAFFALAWRDLSRGQHGDRFAFLQMFP